MIALHNEELSILFHFVDSNCTVYNFGNCALIISMDYLWSSSPEAAEQRRGQNEYCPVPRAHFFVEVPFGKFALDKKILGL